MNPKKTPMQIRVEMLATNGRGYSNVPYTKAFGEKSALRQWLRFSRVRVYNTTINETRGDKLSLFPYLILYAGNRIDRIFKKIEEDVLASSKIAFYPAEIIPTTSGILGLKGQADKRNTLNGSFNWCKIYRGSANSESPQSPRNSDRSSSVVKLIP